MPDTIRGRFLWHELTTSDTGAAVAFYGKVIGWEKQSWGADSSYTLLAYQGEPMAGVMGRRANDPAAPPRWLPYIGSPDVHVTTWDAQRLGATLLHPPEKTPQVGTWAIVQDPWGAVFGVLTPEQAPGANDRPGIGDFSWHELATTDHRAAFNFYRELFGWTKTGATDMGPPLGEYLMYGIGKNSLGGMYSKGNEIPGPSAWNSYIHVKDAKATTRAIVPAGGTIVNGPLEVPGGDWVTMAFDPQGAMFAVHSLPVKTPAKAAKPSRAKPAAKKKVSRRTARPAKRAKNSPAKKKAPAKARARRTTRKGRRK